MGMGLCQRLFQLVAKCVVDNRGKYATGLTATGSHHDALNLTMNHRAAFGLEFDLTFVQTLIVQNTFQVAEENFPPFCVNNKVAEWSIG